MVAYVTVKTQDNYITKIDSLGGELMEDKD